MMMKKNKYGSTSIFRGATNTSTSPRTCSIRRVSSLYFYLAFPCLVWMGIGSLRDLDRAMSLDRKVNDPLSLFKLKAEVPSSSSSSQSRKHRQDDVGSKETASAQGLPDFRHRDPRFEYPPITGKRKKDTAMRQQQQQQQPVPKSQNWWTRLQDLQQQSGGNAVVVSTTSGVSHPEFVQILKQRRQELEGNMMAAASQQNQPPRPVVSQWKTAPTPTNQTISFGEFVLPPPRIPPHYHQYQYRHPQANIVILVLSAQQNFDRRQAIRETWARPRQPLPLVLANSSSSSDQHIPVYFVVGQSNCHELAYRTTSSSSSNAHQNTSTSTDCLQHHHNLLWHEQITYQDLLEIPMTESYSRLPEKVIQAYHWTLQHFPSVQWLVKVDDDTYARPQILSRYLAKYNADAPIWIGKMIPHSRVARGGKWSETKRWEGEYYPYWAIGSAGHAISRTIADYIVKNSASLHRYQGEDVSLGIWLHHWQQQQKTDFLHAEVTYIQANHMITNDGTSACGRSEYLLIGHDLTLEEMYDCYLRFNRTSSDDVLDNTWVDQPAEFAELVRQLEDAEEEKNSGAYERSGNGGGFDSNILLNGGGKASYSGPIPVGRKIGYEYDPSQFRDHLAKASS